MSYCQCPSTGAHTKKTGIDGGDENKNRERESDREREKETERKRACVLNIVSQKIPSVTQSGGRGG